MDTTETTASLLWFATIQRIESKQDLACLAPKGSFISAEAVEREVRQIGETQKATRELSGGTNDRSVRFWARAGRHSRPVGNAVSRRNPAEIWMADRRTGAK